MTGSLNGSFYGNRLRETRSFSNLTAADDAGRWGSVFTDMSRPLPLPIDTPRGSLLVRLLIALAVLIPVIPSNSHAFDPETVVKANPNPDEVEFLLKEFPKGWVHFSAEAASPLNATWQLQREAEPLKDPKDLVLICLGKVDGYIRTEKEYQDFELSLEWKYPTDPNGNSGILLYTIEKDMIWPKSVQVQLHRPTAGSVFPSNGAKVDNPLPAKDLSRAVNVWNECVIVSVDGKVTVSMNGHKVGEVTGCMPNKGCVGLQSEGSEIHFRKIAIKALAPQEKRISSRKLSIRHKKTPVCPPQYQFTQVLPGDLQTLTPAEALRMRLESQRAARVFRRIEIRNTKHRSATVNNFSTDNLQ